MSMPAQAMQMIPVARMSGLQFALDESTFAPNLTTYSNDDSSQWTWSFDTSGQASLCLNTQTTPTQNHMDTTAMSFPRQEYGTNTIRQRRAHVIVHQNVEANSWYDNGTCHEEPEAKLEEQMRFDSREMADSLLRQLEAGGEDQWMAVSQFQHLAFSTQASSLAAQTMLKEASGHDAALLASSMQGNVRRASKSKHANYVMQKIVEVMPMARTSFVAEELLGVAHETACHRFGCRLLCRILEHWSPSDVGTLALLEELLVNAEELCSHTFGSYVIRHILEFGQPQHKHRVAAALLPQAAWLAKHRLASHVVESALRSCSAEDQRTLAEALLANQNVASLSTNQFGRHVVRALFTLPATREQVESALREVEDQIKYSRFGKTMLQSLSAEPVRARF
jgi:hypothetical protein